MRIITKEERFITKTEWLESHHVFNFNRNYLPDRNGFGRVLVVNDDIVAAHAGFPTHAHSHMEIVTYIVEGQITHEDSMGNRDTIHSGEMQLMSVGGRVEHSEFNEGDRATRLLQVWILPENEYDTSHYMTVLPDREGKRIIDVNTTPAIRSHIEMVISRNTEQISLHGSQLYNTLIYIIHGQVSCQDKIYGTGDTFLLSRGEVVEFSSKDGYEYLSIMDTE